MTRAPALLVRSFFDASETPGELFSRRCPKTRPAAVRLGIDWSGPSLKANPRIVEKVLAYVTNARRLLVFAHDDFPAVGLQVPGGTIRVGEPPEAAVRRELSEETGLVVGDARSLGIHDFDASSIGKAEIHRRHYFHVALRGRPAERWKHHELDPHGESPRPIAFSFSWLPLSEAAARLAADQGRLVPTLIRRGLARDADPGSR